MTLPPSAVVLRARALRAAAAAAALERRGDAGASARTGSSATTPTSRCSTASELLVKSPGVPGEAPLVVAARRAGFPSGARSSSASGCSRQPARRRHRHERQDDDERAARRDASAPPAGRSPSPATSAARSTRRGRAADAWIVCELSSFQLEDVARASRASVAVLLNLEPDHLDRHGDVRGYRDAKLRIFENQRADDVASSRAASAASEGSASSSPPTTRCPPSRASRARTTARTPPPRPPPRRAAGIDDDAIAEALRDVPGRPAPARARPRARRRPLRQRLEGDERRRGARAALAAYRRAAAPDPRRPREGRGLRAARRRELRRERRGVYLIGEAAAELAAALDAQVVRYERAGDLERAVAAPPPRPRARRRRPALARLRELRPVPRLRGARRGRSARLVERTLPVKRGETQRSSRTCSSLVTLALVAFGLVMVYSATSAPAALGDGEPDAATSSGRASTRVIGLAR